jgi:hypothetical protein
MVPIHLQVDKERFDQELQKTLAALRRATGGGGGLE